MTASIGNLPSNPLAKPAVYGSLAHRSPGDLGRMEMAAGGSRIAVGRAV